MLLVLRQTHLAKINDIFLVDSLEGFEHKVVDRLPRLLRRLRTRRHRQVRVSKCLLTRPAAAMCAEGKEPMRRGGGKYVSLLIS